MRHKRLKLTGLLLFGLGLTGVQAQTINIKEKNGTQNAYALSSVRKMTFSGGIATVQKTDNSTGAYSLGELRYLNFITLTTAIAEPTMQFGTSNLVTYPNPVTDLLNVDLTGVIGEGTISILTLEGKVMQTQNTSGNRLVTINLSHLPKGFYLCQYRNTIEQKTMKIIKQ